MKQNILSMLLFAAVFVGCRNEEIEKELPSGKTAVTIEVEGEQPGNARTVSFTGGTAYGEGLYDGAFRPTVGADASDGYEIDYFYGGPSSEPKKYDYTSNGTSASFWVYLNGMDHHFKCAFKEKKRTLTLSANPFSGGSVSGGGTYKVKQPISISASPASGYTFSGWTVSSGDATIANASSASTTATLQSSNSTLTANFVVSEITTNVSIALTNDSFNSSNSGYYYRYILLSSNIGNRVSLKVNGQSNYYNGLTYPLSIPSGTKTKYYSNDWITIDYDGNTEEETATPLSFDLLIDNVTVLSGLKSPSGAHALDFEQFNGRTYTQNGYKIVFSVK